MIIARARVTATGNRTRLTAFFNQLFFYLLLATVACRSIHPPIDPGSVLLMNLTRAQRWSLIVDQVTAEYQALSAAERHWIRCRLRRIARLQRALEELFRVASGAELCRCCRGQCCAHGHNHMTLVNLLGCLDSGRLPPPDFSLVCPFLGSRGCRLESDVRPYNCISFICDTIENALRPEQLDRFYRIERLLRRHYQKFAERFPGGGMTGLLLQEQRLDGRPFLSRP